MVVAYIGFRVEISKKALVIKDLDKKYNSSHLTKIFDLHYDGRITIEKRKDILLVKGVKLDKSANGMSNFAVMTKVKSKSEAERLAKIMNVLGNDRLIRERVGLFVNQKSVLNSIPELDPLRDAFLDLESLLPGFSKLAWYYCPELRT